MAGSPTSQQYCCKGELEDAVEQREGEHHVEFLRAEGKLHDGGAQLAVLHPGFQSHCPAPARA